MRWSGKVILMHEQGSRYLVAVFPLPRSVQLAQNYEVNIAVVLILIEFKVGPIEGLIQGEQVREL